jgi:hypothetical protein
MVVVMNCYGAVGYLPLISLIIDLVKLAGTVLFIETRWL